MCCVPYFRMWFLPSSAAAPLRLAVRASEGEAPAPLQTPPDFGKGGKGSFFGFGPKQELNVGRLAMIGFAVSSREILVEWNCEGTENLHSLKYRSFRSPSELNFYIAAS